MTRHRFGTPVGVENDTIHVVFELSKESWLIGIVLPGSSKLSRYKVRGGDIEAVSARLAQARATAARRVAGPLKVVSAYEAGYDGFWLHRWLAARGVVNHVLDPASIRVNRRARRAKTDRLDLEQLMRVLLAHQRGEPRVCSVAVAPSVPDEDRRSRERDRLRRERDAHSNRIKALLFSQGIRGVDPRRADFPERLPELRTGTGEPLGPELIGELGREWRRLRLVLEQMVELEAHTRSAERHAAPGSAEEKTTLLTHLRGIGEVGSRVLVNEAFYRRFDNRRQLGSYFGLTSTPYDSGKSRREQGISKAGNPRARNLAIQLAWLWLRHQPNSALSQWFEARVGDKKGAVRKIAIVALARKLMIALWRFLETGLIPEGAELKGSPRR